MECEDSSGTEIQIITVKTGRDSIFQYWLDTKLPVLVGSEVFQTHYRWDTNMLVNIRMM